MAPWPPISRDDLRHAAGSAGFDTDFPLLIRRLIAETGREVTELDMPGGSGTAAGGFDGVVVASEQALFVPSGMSVWELSVQQGAQAKADQDYAKRSTGPTGEDPSEITYVQVILASWTKAKIWAAGHGAEQRWKEVRAYNLDQVHTWLDSAPATMVWLAERLGKALPGVRHARSWWEDTWIPSTKVSLTAELVLAGRGAAAVSMADLLASGRKTITVGGDLRTDELHAFVAAALARMSTAHDKGADARTLLVRSSDSLAQLLGQPQPLVLVVPDARLLSDLPHLHPHQIVMPAALGGNAAVDVPRVDGEAVSELLITAEVEHEHAYMYGTLARRSIPALRRALAVQPEILTPTWAQAPGFVVRRLLLVAAWNGLASADRELLEDFLGRAYAEIREAGVALVSEGEDPFLGSYSAMT
ncbi:hypothetical protein [Umezawaea sp. Da 62-37]|uniref:hypothetical protein n=1 Tax=Umezawaea sp. Da 62-37 TaxID=3075927 RepID=UPI0028F7444C|nr:hypothetical protein [Umezawaea sp. Da 62-37]WNV84874.1 hypothetical protein RM788_43065 [Umezawaea sp. Da 62-37]